MRAQGLGGNRRRERNSFRLPLILLIVIAGGLVGTRWMKEMRINHELHRLATEQRQVEYQISELKRDIKDLEGRFSAMVTRDAVQKTLAERGIVMRKIQPDSVIALEAVKVGMNTPKMGGPN